MDELLREKIRTYGAVAVIMAVFMISVLVFIQFKEKSVTALKLKVVYTEISQTISNTIRDNGLPGSWDIKDGYKNSGILENKIFRYFKYSKNCIHNPNGCTPEKNYKSIKLHETDINLYNLPSITMKNGATISIETAGTCQKPDETCATIFIDTNGKDEPNALGKDLFVYLLRNSQTTPFVPYGNTMSLYELKNNKDFGCNKKAKMALYCAALIKNTDWKIKADYPW